MPSDRTLPHYLQKGGADSGRTSLSRLIAQVSILFTHKLGKNNFVRMSKRIFTKLNSVFAHRYSSRVLVVIAIVHVTLLLLLPSGFLLLSLTFYHNNLLVAFSPSLPLCLLHSLPTICQDIVFRTFFRVLSTHFTLFPISI